MSHTVYIISFRHRFPFEISFRNSHDVESASFDRRRNIAPDDDWKTPGSNSLEITSDSVLIRSWNWPGCFSLKKLTFNILEFCTNRFWRNLFLWWFNSQFKQAFPVWWCFNYVETSSVPRESLTLQVQSFTSMASIESIKIDVTSSTNQSDHRYSKSTVEFSSKLHYLGMTNIDYNNFFYQ